MATQLFRGDQFTQANRYIRIDTGLGPDTLLLKSIEGSEALSSLFQFDVEMLSLQGDIKAEDIVGDHVSVAIDACSANPRIFNGLVSRFEFTGLERRGIYGYRARFVPWLWFLKNRSNCRVFQNKTVQEILETLFSEFGFSDYRFALSEQYPRLEYCVQYRETDFDFISRLLEQEGIFYYFEHQTDKHVLHLVDSVSSYTSLDPKKVEHSSGSREGEYISTWRHRYGYFPGKWQQTDFNYEKFHHSLFTEVSSVIKLKNNKNFSIYEYPGQYQDNERGAALAKLRMEQQESCFDIISARSNLCSLAAGKKFTLKSDESPADNKKGFVVTRVDHKASESSYLDDDEDADLYSNRFECIPEQVTFRPQPVTAKPRIDGVQTALVVGKSGDEIYTDEYGRIKLQFHWDLYGNRDEDSSCWVRVATQWSGKKWGTIGIPRVGQEVVVTFLNGDPDYPLVIGSVYNSAHMPPYDLPGDSTISGVKSRSTKGGDGSTYNEISMDDRKGSEAITIHAQKDFNIDVGNNVGANAAGNASSNTDGNASTSVGGDNSVSVTGNDSLSVNGNYSGTVDGNKSFTVSGNQESTVSGNDSTSVSGDQDASVGGDRSASVGGNQTASVSGNEEASISGNQTVNVGATQDVSAATHNLNVTGASSTSATEINLSGKSKIALSVGGTSITVDASGVTISMGASSVKVDPSGVSVTGPIVKLN